MVETKYYLTKPGPMGSQSQANTAATYFASSSGARRSQRPRRRPKEPDSAEESDPFPTNFKALVRGSPPQIPGGILRRLETGEAAPSGMGKIRVVLRVADSKAAEDTEGLRRHFQVGIYSAMNRISKPVHSELTLTYPIT